MIQILSNSNEPAFNLALEEYLLKKTSNEYFLVYINKPSVIIGRNQNPFQEVDLDYIESESIELHRRISGGGAVYHDLGNINFSFIVNGLDHLNDYEYFIKQITNKMENAGVQLSFKEPSHIYLENQKISGNAQTFYKNRVLHHGTILFDTDLDCLTRLIKKKSDVQSKSIKSNVADVCNLREYIGYNALIHILLPEYRTLTDEEIEGAMSFEAKYHTWKWKFAESPRFEVLVNDSIKLHVKNGIIIDSSILELVGIPLKMETLEKLSFPNKEEIIQKIKTL